MEYHSESTSLAALHAQIAACTICGDVLDPQKAPRRTEAGPLRTPLMIISQALARDTQRVSGIPYVGVSGAVSDTGARLEAFLNRIDFSLLPMRGSQDSNGDISIAPAHCRQAYNSEIVQCFPGRVETGQGDHFPTIAARRCLERRFLEREIELVDPELLILLGTKTSDFFIRHFGGAQRFADSVTVSLQSFDPQKALIQLRIAGRLRYVVRLIHPSGLTRGRFQRFVMDNDRLIDSIRLILSRDQSLSSMS